MSEAINIFRREECFAKEYDGENWGARISSVFVILVTSSFGAFFPVLSSRYSFIRLPSWVFFIAKYFGSGVIVATAFIHLLEPANDNLSSECLGGTWNEYPWAFGIALITLFLMFLFELIAFHYVDAKIFGSGEGHSHSHFGDADLYLKNGEEDEVIKDGAESEIQNVESNPYPKHFQHAKDHQDQEAVGTPVNDKEKEQYYGQLVSVFVLEFGIMFHSVFVGLSLAVSGDEFKTLYVVLVFHQMFEGLGLGTRIAQVPWPNSKRWTPWVLALAFGLCTPIAIAIGLGVRTSYSPNSRKAMITNGLFDSISAGILIYAGIVELLAHEFLYSGEFKGKNGLRKMLLAYFIVCWGAGLMALLGRWA